jgi:hypothetical protein
LLSRSSWPRANQSIAMLTLMLQLMMHRAATLFLGLGMPKHTCWSCSSWPWQLLTFLLCSMFDPGFMPWTLASWQESCQAGDLVAEHLRPLPF